MNFLTAAVKILFLIFMVSRSKLKTAKIFSSFMILGSLLLITNLFSVEAAWTNRRANCKRPFINKRMKGKMTHLRHRSMRTKLRMKLLRTMTHPAQRRYFFHISEKTRITAAESLAWRKLWLSWSQSCGGTVPARTALSTKKLGFWWILGRKIFQF